jgi:hypothetical protein
MRNPANALRQARRHPSEDKQQGATRRRLHAVVRRVSQSHLGFRKVRMAPTAAPTATPQATLAAISFVAAPNAAPMAAPMAMLMLIAVPERQLFGLVVVCCVFIILCKRSMLPNYY